MNPLNVPLKIENAEPARRDYPTRLYVETTSRCNLNCLMCMKQTSGKSCVDGDLSTATFARLEPYFPQLESLVLNGVGEPLLNPHLEEFIRTAKARMPAKGWVGFQSNGLLLTALRAISLANAGLDRICLSLDGVTPDTFRNLRSGGELDNLKHALDAMAKAKHLCNRPELAVGVEFVAMRNNLRELPAALRWAAEKGVSFAIVSHLLPYDEEHAADCAYGLCTDAALAHFDTWKKRAVEAGIVIDRYFDILWKYKKSPEERRIIAFVETMKSDALYHGITLDLKHLLAFDLPRHSELLQIFAEARAVAAETGIELQLPATAPQQERICDFIENGGTFISWDGSVHPCYYLWHHCRSFASGWLHPVQPRLFGNLGTETLGEIWNDADYRTYRENVLRRDYPFCAGCPTSPCDYIQAEPFSQDCYLNTEPCGACLWSSGLFRCLS